MTTMRFLLDVTAPNAQATFDKVGTRLADLDRKLAKTRQISVSDADAAVVIARLGVKADKLRAKLGSMPVDLKGAKAAELQLLTLEATAGRLDKKLSDIGSGGGGLSGLLSKLAGGGDGKGIPSLGLLGAGLGGAAAGAPALAVLAGALGGVASAAGSAALGLGSFAALAVPTIQKLMTNFQTLSGAIISYSDASANLDSAIHSSKANWKLYQATIHGLEPDFQNAARLLTNQNVKWQNLTPSMKASVIALSNNKTALRLLLPDQKAALTALLAQQDAWDNLSPAQQTAARAMQGLTSEFRKMQTALAPLTFKVFNDGLRIANHLLPDLMPFATAAGNALDGLLKKLDKLVTPAAAGKGQTGFQKFLQVMQKQAGPAITAIGTGFGQLAGAFANLMTAFAKNNRGITAVKILFDILAGAINGIAWVVNKVAQRWQEWKNLFHDFAHWWDMFWNNTIGRMIRGVSDVHKWDANMRHDIANTFDRIRHDIASIWDTIWNNTIGRLIRGVHDVLNWIGGLPGKIKGLFAKAGTWLISGGQNIITGLWNGIKKIWNDVTSWFSGLPGKIMHALGIASPPAWAIDSGKHIMGGLLKGVAHGAADVKGFFRGLATSITGPLKSIWNSVSGGVTSLWDQFFGGGGSSSSVSGGVSRWSRMVLDALALLGQPASDLGVVLSQMQTESGGNPMAVNNWDANALAGTPSKGLMQVIGPTFAAYAGPFASKGIYDPFANIFAGLNYAIHRYGSGWTSVLGHGHGYASGGVITEPVMGFGRSGQLYSFGERGPERVTPGAGPVTGGRGITIENLNVNHVPGYSTPADVDQAVAHVLRRYRLARV